MHSSRPLSDHPTPRIVPTTNEVLTPRHLLASTALSPDSPLRPPSSSVVRSFQTSSSDQSSSVFTHPIPRIPSFVNRQPIHDPHHRFLHRTESNCPSHLTGSQRTNWLKAGRKAQQNQAILASLLPFQCWNNQQDEPVFVHSRQSEFTLQVTISKIESVRLFTIDTECDRPTRQFPSSTPALLQIQAIHNAHQSTFILIEIQYLPPTWSPLFTTIRQLCHSIFAPQNRIMAWGDVHAELRPFCSFDIFDITRVQTFTNLQAYFASKWNQQHPHQPLCLATHSRTPGSFNDCSTLFPSILSEDSDEEINSSSILDDSPFCICSAEIRPYKTKKPLWSLQKAIEMTFDRALDKSLTFNVWSCGLDSSLHDPLSSHELTIRERMVAYAIHDLIAPTALYLHFHEPPTPSSSVSTFRSLVTPQTTGYTSSPNFHPSSSLSDFSVTTIDPTATLPSCFVLSDSHGRFIPSTLTTAHYHLTTATQSGLQWRQSLDVSLCAYSLLRTPKISSIISSSSFVLLLIGSNSVRSHPANIVLEQVIDVISLLRRHNPHLSHSHALTVSLCFPCLKQSNLFRTTSSLTANVSMYNDRLQSIAMLHNFTVLDFGITVNQLSPDLLHVAEQYRNLIRNKVFNHLNELISSQRSSLFDASNDSSRFVLAPQSSLFVNQNDPPRFDAPHQSSPLVDQHESFCHADPHDSVLLVTPEEALPSLVDRTEPNASSVLAETTDPARPSSTAYKSSSLFNSQKPTQSQTRSKEANARRNKKRHEKTRIEQRRYSLERQVHSAWTVTQLKEVLRAYSVRYGRLCPLTRHVLRLQFNKDEYRQKAESRLPHDVFDQIHYLHWMNDHS